MQRTRGLVALSLTLVLIAACSSGKSSSNVGASQGSSTAATAAPPTKGTYTIGMSVDLSGTFSANGQGLQKGAQAYVDAVNKNGGVNGYKVALEFTDDASKTDRGVANVTQMITDKKALGVSGFVLSNVCGAAAPVVAEQKVPMVCNALGEDLLNPVQPYVYSARGLTANEAAPMVSFAQTLVKSGKPKVAYIGLASAAIKSLHSDVVAIAKAKGWEVVAEEEVPLTATDISAPVSKVVGGKPDIILAALNDPLMVLFARTMQSQSADIPVVDYTGGSSFSTLKSVESENLYMLRPFEYVTKNPDSEGVKQYVIDTKAAGLDPNGDYVVNGYIQAMIMVAGLKGCAEPCTPQGLQQSLDKVNVDTKGLTAGPLTFTPTDHEILHALNVYVWDSSKGETKVVQKNLPGGRK
jgi:branched-chain amino acid transport system substrate-binding protein